MVFFFFDYCLDVGNEPLGDEEGVFQDGVLLEVPQEEAQQDRLPLVVAPQVIHPDIGVVQEMVRVDFHVLFVGKCVDSRDRVCDFGFEIRE
jgi:hypothetical protein